MSSLLKNLFVILGLVLIAGLGYFLYSQNTSLSVDSSDELLTEQASLETELFLHRLNDLENIQLNKDFLSDPRFTGLQNYSSEIPDYPVGRPFPFQLTE